MQRVAIYVRVSTQEQADEGYSIGAQTERLQAYCKARDWMVHDTYVDPGYSGSNTDRPGLKKLILDAKKNKFDIVLVYKLDRLSRSQKDTLMLIEDVFLKNNVSFVSINENFDTSTAFGRAMIGILSVFAQLEREQIKERTLMGRIERAKDGYFHGGGFDPIGYDYVDGNLVVNEYEALQVKKVFELFLDGWAISKIQKYMNKNYKTKYGTWESVSTVASTLVQPIVTGKILYQGKIYPGRHEAIIDDETFKKANERYEEIRWNKHDTKEIKRPFISNYILNGLLYCKHCGARYYVKGNYSGRGENRYYRPYYVCYSRGKSYPRYVTNENCINKSYYFKDLDKMILDEVRKLKFDPSYIKKIQDQVEDKVNPIEEANRILEEKVEDIDRQMKRMLDLYQVGSIPTDVITERINELSSQKAKVLSQIVEVVPEVKLSFDETLSILETMEKVLEGTDEQKKKEFLGSLIDKIEIDNEDIIIHWAFA